MMPTSSTGTEQGMSTNAVAVSDAENRRSAAPGYRVVLRLLPALAVLGIGIGMLASTDPIAVPAQPQPDALSYADGAVQIANGNGFRLRYDETKALDQQSVNPPLAPSRYPPGFSLALVPFVEFGNGDITDTQLGSKVYAVLLLVLVFAATWLLGGPWAAALAAAATIAAPFTTKSAQLVMSDAFGAALTVGVLVAVLLGSRRTVGGRTQQICYIVAGFLAAYAVLARTAAVTTLIALVIAARRWPQMRMVVLGAAPVLIMLWTYQWTEFGHPLANGYDYYLPGLKVFGAEFVTAEYPQGERMWIHSDRLHGALMRWTCPCDDFGPIGKASNLIFYPSVLLGLYWVYLPPLLSTVGVWELVRRRATPAARYASLAIAANLLIFLPYFYQGARLVAPAAFLLLIYSAAGVTRLSDLAICSLRRRIGHRDSDRANGTVEVSSLK